MCERKGHEPRQRVVPWGRSWVPHLAGAAAARPGSRLRGDGSAAASRSTHTPCGAAARFRRRATPLPAPGAPRPCPLPGRARRQPAPGRYGNERGADRARRRGGSWPCRPGGSWPRRLRLPLAGAQPSSPRRRRGSPRCPGEGARLGRRNGGSCQRHSVLREAEGP